jgi:NAD(P)-dependent dehydrogenase (short-subunit alcohol dehydrogenase family)
VSVEADSEREPGVTIDGRRVIVTGASSGLGAHIVRRLARLGADVVAVARRADRLEALAAELAGAAGRVIPWPADVTVDAQVRAMVAAAVEAFGGIDVLVNNAGSEVQGPIDSLTDEDFEGMLRANVSSVVLCTRAALPELRRSLGVIINLGSTVVARPPRGRFGYVASKGAVEAMSRALALDLGRDGIRVNVIRPGIIPSELRGLSEDAERAKLETGVSFGKQALSAVGDGRDIAEAVAWLAGEGGRWITGAVIDVDGGFTLGAADVI